jgi:hypothetical protein
MDWKGGTGQIEKLAAMQLFTLPAGSSRKKRVVRLSSMRIAWK